MQEVPHVPFLPPIQATHGQQGWKDDEKINNPKSNPGVALVASYFLIQIQGRKCS